MMSSEIILIGGLYVLMALGLLFGAWLNNSIAAVKKIRNEWELEDED